MVRGTGTEGKNAAALCGSGRNGENDTRLTLPKFSLRLKERGRAITVSERRTERLEKVPIGKKMWAHYTNIRGGSGKRKMG